MPSIPKRALLPTAALSCAVVASLAFTPRNSAVAAHVQLGMATLHAAALSTSRSAHDTADAPYLFITVFGPGAARRSMELPSANKHWSVRLDEAKGAAPFTSLTVAPGDSVRVLYTLLEADQVNSGEESAAGTALSKVAVSSSANVSGPAIASLLAPLTTRGAHWIGSATILVTNEGGKTYWRSLDCVSTCKVSRSPFSVPSGKELAPNTTDALAGVVELNGSAATYHLQLTAKRSM